MLDCSEKPISKSVKKKDHSPKMSGAALYIDDYVMNDMLYGHLLRSTKAKAKILDIRIPNLEEGYGVVTALDVPGENKVAIVERDTPVFAEKQVEFIGDPILMVVGPDDLKTLELLNQIEVVYEELEPILDIRKSDTVFFNYEITKGNVKTAFEEADEILEEQFETGHQEQVYLETQGMIVWPHDGRITIRGSLQCPYYVKGAVCFALGYKEEDVQVIQAVTGGGFGGKEAFPSILACQTAVAALKMGKPVKIIFDRREDLEFTSKRHPSLCTYRIALKNGEITAMDIDVVFNSGAYTTLSPVVLQRGLICANGVYRIENLSVHGRAVKTNTVPCGAYRGFGAPQTFFAVEMMMNHVAKHLDIDSLELKEKYMVKQGDSTSTSGKYHYPIPLPEMIKRLEELTDYRNKRKEYAHQTGRYRKGIGLSLFFHGCGFTGSGERDHIKAVLKLRKTADDKIEILGSNSDIGQGLKTTFSKIASDTLGVPYDDVSYENPDTDIVPDSGPTVASRSLMVVGELIRQASEELKKTWKSGEEQMIEVHFKEPDFVIPFDLASFKGDAYPTFSWSANVIEVQVDTLTATSEVLGAYGIYDVGIPIDYNIIKGQMEGGYLQGLGYAFMERITPDKNGRIRNNSLSDYIIPTSVDIPNMVVEIMNNPYSHGPYGAKGAGELPLVGAAPAYLDAMEQALDSNLRHIPFMPEDAMKVLQEVKSR